LGADIKLPFPITRLKKKIEKQTDREGDDIWLCVVEKASGELVGSTDVHATDTRHRSFEYGIEIFAEHRRKGYASEAVALLLRYYFLELGYRRAQATVYEFNPASQLLQRSLGFTEEGRLRKSLYTNGEFHDEIVYGLLAEEFGPLGSRLPDAGLQVSHTA
jgi:RimJ/RimL family protein N-acetyltransferase